MAPPAECVHRQTGTGRMEFKMKLWLYIPFFFRLKHFYLILNIISVKIQPFVLTYNLYKSEPIFSISIIELSNLK